MHFAYTFQRKNGIQGAIDHFTNLVKNQWNTSVKIYRSDNEQTLGHDFDSLTSQNGIIHQTSVRGQPEQNSRGERSGGMILQKARPLLINARIPLDLWPEAINAAVYILNRSPTKQLEWKTPFEMLTGKCPNLANLYTFGCRAYFRDQNLANTQKMAPRALVGYLVGYKASNIWKIWQPRQRKVIESRDVTFDESCMYNPCEPFLEDLIQEAAPEPPTEVLRIPKIAKATPTVEIDDSPEGVTVVKEKNYTNSTNQAEPQKQAYQEAYPEQPVKETLFQPPPTPETTPPPADHPPGLPDQLDYQLEQPDDPPEPPEMEEPDSPSRILLDSLNSDQSHPLGSIWGGEAEPQPQQELPPQRRPRKEVDENNIILGKRNKKKPNDPYLKAYSATHWPDSLLSAFAIGLNHQPSTSMRKIHRDDLPSPPDSWNEMLKHPLRDQFIASAALEYKTIQDKGTVRVVEQSQASQIIPLRWVFAYKFNEDGYLLKTKARICVRGDLQAHSMQEKRAATLAAKTFRSICALIAAFDMETTQYDAVNAFLNALMDEDIYVAMPQGYGIKGKAWKLLRALYGLRRSPRLWQKDLSATLQEFGLEPVNEDQCLFTNNHILLMVYVDDIIIANMPNQEARENAQKLKQALEAQYELRNMGELSWFLGIRVIRDRTNRKLWLCQDAYIEHMATRYHLNDLTTYPKTPGGSHNLVPNQEIASPAQIHHYQQKIGSSLYTTVISRPDAARTVNKLAEFMSNPSQAHLEALDRVIAYLYFTRFYAIEFSGLTNQNHIFLCASDASFADNLDRKSTEGLLCKLYGGPIDWRASKQRTVTTSTTEAELLAISEAAKSIFWWKRLFNAIDFDPEHCISIQCDNRQTIGLLTKEDPMFRTKLRHVDVHGHWLRQEVQNGNIHVQWVPTAEMPADGLTKLLPDQKHQEFIKMLGLVNIQDRILA
ncbi:hypothetical protein EYZ11_013195 [Aspergillus tanneri]|uniref:Integrase catalytic domain-containing protein n=1 Tax=Aspergillus tanneri TaxID=1220188 RepID=A0A4S3IY98_9EURO|nr:hypothetical protein EYZ11_013195 [Aspergillus tanneri]